MILVQSDIPLKDFNFFQKFFLGPEWYSFEDIIVLTSFEWVVNLNNKSEEKDFHAKILEIAQETMDDDVERGAFNHESEIFNLEFLFHKLIHDRE